MLLKAEIKTLEKRIAFLDLEKLNEIRKEFLGNFQNSFFFVDTSFILPFLIMEREINFLSQLRGFYLNSKYNLTKKAFNFGSSYTSNVYDFVQDKEFCAPPTIVAEINCFRRKLESDLKYHLKMRNLLKKELVCNSFIFHSLRGKP